MTSQMSVEAGPMAKFFATSWMMANILHLFLHLFDRLAIGLEIVNILAGMATMAMREDFMLDRVGEIFDLRGKSVHRNENELV
eukprot:CAMPEP_0114578484 /NCGR_PEP_ID=MMETSP0125-20121206/3018_1 /TAXON_ID=485358 ORGANISM="Aristerostoma sp., Strain ATCC 50986" /NCGR_SAMPLE_ID=MMETSP0125 /ASSEMBLY_ACC=CAM_ASM_000245 /LENGTH=82 /DNA_ID=CAMNT_0001768589 /DNA_START=361 /DNA_END=609 /DNA_ORIENTATION=-